MHLLVEFGTLILTAYLAFTTALAGLLTHTPTQPSSLPDTIDPPSDLISLGSAYGHTSIPDILLTNAAFQGAAVIGSEASPEQIHNIGDATVNIFCTYTTDEFVRTTTGSGFFISAAGSVLTNAHVAQFLLLEASQQGGETECVLRTGDPAVALYKAELLYLPPAWISENASLIRAETPRGTGERDYALLYASASLTNEPLPARFPYLQLSTDTLTHRNIGDSVAVAGYPAAPLHENGFNADLPLATAASRMTDLFTFGTNTADLMSLYDSSVSAGGASGGPVTNYDGQAVGVIVTRGESTTDSLRALTLAYVNRTILEETGFTLTEYIRSDLAVRARVFNEALAPFLRTLLEYQLVD